MRSRSPLRLSALLLVLMLVLVAGCSDDGGGDDDSASDDDTTQQADDSDGANGTGDGDVANFCQDFRGVADEYLNADAPSTDAETWAAYRAALQGLDPPAAIASDWKVVVDSVEGEDDADGDDASRTINAWLKRECGFNLYGIPVPSGNGDPAVFCQEFRSIIDDYANAETLTNQEQFGAYILALLAVNPPAAVADDWMIIIDSFESGSGSDEVVAEARENLSAWTIEECGFDPEDSGSE